MNVEIQGYNEKRKNEVIEAATSEWNFPDGLDEDKHNKTLYGGGESNLCGGESEEQFAERFAKAVWKANGKYCKVWVQATFLEDLPHEDYFMDEAQYDLLMEKA
jgi:hypothetical protein